MSIPHEGSLARSDLFSHHHRLASVILVKIDSARPILGLGSQVVYYNDFPTQPVRVENPQSHTLIVKQSAVFPFEVSANSTANRQYISQAQFLLFPSNIHRSPQSSTATQSLRH